jgi:hypothetical protein
MPEERGWRDEEKEGGKREERWKNERKKKENSQTRCPNIGYRQDCGHMGTFYALLGVPEAVLPDN